MDSRTPFFIKLWYYSRSVQCCYCNCGITKSSAATILQKNFEWDLLKFLTTMACFVYIKNTSRQLANYGNTTFDENNYFDIFAVRHDVRQLRKNPRISS